jgi:hypothetical protein
MWPNVVVPESEQMQRGVQLPMRIDLSAIELVLQRTEEAYDAPGLPGVQGLHIVIELKISPLHSRKLRREME